MNPIAILPNQRDDELIGFSAVNAEWKATGRTAGEALDALTSQSRGSSSATTVIVQQFRPDQFFSISQRNRLSELMTLWRKAREEKTTLPSTEEAELEKLIDLELLGTAERSALIQRDFEMTHARELLKAWVEPEKRFISLGANVIGLGLVLVASVLMARGSIALGAGILIIGVIGSSVTMFLTWRQESVYKQIIRLLEKDRNPNERFTSSELFKTSASPKKLE